MLLVVVVMILTVVVFEQYKHKVSQFYLNNYVRNG